MGHQCREDRTSISSRLLADPGGYVTQVVVITRLEACSPRRLCPGQVHFSRCAELIGERDGQHVAMKPLLGSLDPRLEPWLSHLAGFILTSTTHAACTNRTRRYRLPRLDILPWMVRSPVEICFRTRPSHVAKSRPLAKASPAPIAAAMALEMIGPMPGMLISRSHPGSRLASSPISLDNPRCVHRRDESQYLDGSLHAR